MQFNQEFYGQLGSLIAEYRKACNLKQSELAEKIGVNTMTISRYEQGLTKPSMENLKQICKILNVSLERLSYIAKERVSLSKPEDIINVVTDDFIRLPLYSQINCNNLFTNDGLLGMVSISSYDLDTSLKYFAVRCHDNSMIYDHIGTGDSMIFIQTDKYSSEDIVCVCANGVPLIRRIIDKNDYVCLVASNSRFQPLFMKRSEIKPLGILRRLVKEF